jgi:hypothetical protein
VNFIELAKYSCQNHFEKKFCFSIHRGRGGWGEILERRQQRMEEKYNSMMDREAQAIIYDRADISYTADITHNGSMR